MRAWCGKHSAAKLRFEVLKWNWRGEIKAVELGFGSCVYIRKNGCGSFAEGRVMGAEWSCPPLEPLGLGSVLVVVCRAARSHRVAWTGTMC